MMLKHLKLRKETFIIFVILAGITAGMSITSGKLFYFGLFLVPIFIYLCIEKPIIFPIGLYIFFIPFDDILMLTTSGGTGPTLTKFLGILIILVLVFKGVFEKKLHWPDSAALWWLLFIVHSSLTLSWAIDFDLGYGIIPTAVGLLILYFLMVSYKLQWNEYNQLKLFILAGGAVAALLIIYNFAIADTVSRTSLSIGGRDTRLNSTAFSILFPISICLERLLTQRTITMRVFLSGILALMVFSVIVTGSRGATLGVGIIFMVYLLSLSIKKKLTFGLVLLIIAILVLTLVPSYYTVERWEQAAETGGSGRLDIWYVGWKALGKYLLYGAGINNFPLAYKEFVYFSPSDKTFRAAHNLYLQVIVEGGIIGFSLMIMALVTHYRTLRSRYKNKDMNKIMLKAIFGAILSFSVTGDPIWTKSFWVPFMMILIYKNVGLYNQNTTSGNTNENSGNHEW